MSPCMCIVHQAMGHIQLNSIWAVVVTSAQRHSDDASYQVVGNVRGRKSRRLCVKPQTAGFPAFGFRPSIHLRFPCTRVLHSWISLYSDRQGFHDTTADGICIRGSRADLGVDLDPCYSRFFHSETLEPNYHLIYMKVMMKILMTSCAFLFLLLIITPG